MGVGPAGAHARPVLPPGTFGGNMDIRQTARGSTRSRTPAATAARSIRRCSPGRSTRLPTTTLEMKAEGIVNFGIDLDNPSFAQVGHAVGLHAARAEHPSRLGDGLRTAFAHPGPALVEVMTARQLSIPPQISLTSSRRLELLILELTLERCSHSKRTIHPPGRCDSTSERAI